MWDPAGLLGRLSRSRQAQGDSARMSQVTPDSRGAGIQEGPGQEPGEKAGPAQVPLVLGVRGRDRSPPRTSEPRAELSRDPTGQGTPLGHSLSHRPPRLARGRGIPSEARRATQKGGTAALWAGSCQGGGATRRPRVGQQVRTLLWGQEAGGPQGLGAEEDGVSRVRVGALCCKDLVSGTMRWLPGDNITLFSSNHVPFMSQHRIQGSPGVRGCEVCERSSSDSGIPGPQAGAPVDLALASDPQLWGARRRSRQARMGLQVLGTPESGPLF